MGSSLISASSYTLTSTTEVDGPTRGAHDGPVAPEQLSGPSQDEKLSTLNVDFEEVETPNVRHDVVETRARDGKLFEVPTAPMARHAAEARRLAVDAEFHCARVIG
jgi:hypothetical protein